jgi:predicted DNA-binding protein (MmcQ/YjbR family)
MSKALQRAAQALHEFALGLPSAWEDHPWGETVIKVNKKVFLFLGRGDGSEPTWGFSVKLPSSGTALLTQEYATPTGYGLGNSGWVTFEFRAGNLLPQSFLKELVEESYRTVAPKKLSAQLGQQSVPARKTSTPRKAASSAVRKKARRKKRS